MNSILRMICPLPTLYSGLRLAYLWKQADVTTVLRINWTISFPDHYTMSISSHQVSRWVDLLEKNSGLRQKCPFIPACPMIYC